jgi:hypothetical protein
LKCGLSSGAFSRVILRVVTLKTVITQRMPLTTYTCRGTRLFGYVCKVRRKGNKFCSETAHRAPDERYSVTSLTHLGEVNFHFCYVFRNSLHLKQA